MPTGYTAKLYEGEPQTFEEFALDCARQFLPRMKESSGPIPETFEAHNWHRSGLEASQERLADLQALTPVEANARAHQARAKSERERDAARAQREGVRRRCRAMLARVAAWEPPTDEHQGLRRFMLEQLNSTIEFDGRPLHDSDWPLPSSVGEEWRAEEIKMALRDIAYHAEEWAKERDRAAVDTEWVRALRESLVEKVPA